MNIHPSRPDHEKKQQEQTNNQTNHKRIKHPYCVHNWPVRIRQSLVIVVAIPSSNIIDDLRIHLLLTYKVVTSNNRE